MGSLQDALLKSGLADEKKHSEARSGTARPGARNSKSRGKPSGKRPDGRKPRPGASDGARRGNKRRPKQSAGSGGGKTAGGSDLERAYAARRRAELAEKERVKQARVADQEARRKRNLELDKIVEGRILNVDDAELPRYFEHLGRIRRVLCTPEQRTAINAGELGIVNLRGRYLIVAPETLAEYRDRAEDLVPDLSGKEPDGDELNDDYPPVPDDITW